MATIPEAKAKANKLVREGKYDKAIKLYEKIIDLLKKKNRPDYSLYNIVGDIYYNNMKNKDLAVENYRTAMQFYADNGMYPNAIAMAKKIVKIDSEQIDMYEKIGLFNKNQGLIGEAINNYILFAEKSIKKNDNEGGIRAFKEALQMMPDKVEFKEKLVDLYIKVDQIEQAIELLKEIESYYVKMNTMEQAASIRSKIKQLSLKIHKPVEAETVIEQPTAPVETTEEELSIDDIDMDNLMGDLTKELDNTFSESPTQENPFSPPAENIVKSAPVENNANENILTNIQEENASFDFAAEETSMFESYVELGNLQKDSNPEEAVQSFYQAANGYFGKNDFENALRIYKLILDVKPKEIKVLRLIADIAVKLKNNGEAISAYIKLAEIFIDSAPEEALKYANTALSIEPNNMDAMQLKIKILNILNPPTKQEVKPATKKQEPPKVAPKPEPTQTIPPVQESITESVGADFLNEFKNEILENNDSFDFLNEKEQVTAQDIISGKNEGGKPKFKVEQANKNDGDVWSLSELLDELKEGLDENIDADDVASHYELGMSFKEMALLDMAIEEFKKSLKHKDYEMKSLEMLGQCYIEKNELDLAENTLKKALNIKGKQPDEYLGIKHSIAILFEKKGMLNDALKMLKEVQAIKPDFQGLEKHIQLLSDTIAKSKSASSAKTKKKQEEFIDFSELIKEEEFNLDELSDNIDEIDLEFDENDDDNNKKNISYM